MCLGLGQSQRAALKELEGQGLAVTYVVFLLKIQLICLFKNSTKSFIWSSLYPGLPFCLVLHFFSMWVYSDTFQTLFPEAINQKS